MDKHEKFFLILGILFCTISIIGYIAVDIIMFLVLFIGAIVSFVGFMHISEE